MSEDEDLAAAALDEARELVAAGLFQEALVLLERSVELFQSAEDKQEYRYLVSLANFELDELDEAEAHLREGLALGEDANFRELQIEIAAARGDFERALTAADRAIELEDARPGAHHSRGLVLTQLGRIAEADEAFARAFELDPEEHFRPYRLSAEAFDAAVEQALSSLPDMFQEHLENVEIATEEVPGEDLAGEDFSSYLLGIYQGSTIHAGEGGFPDRILLFQRNLENVCEDEDTLLREIHDTVLHEVGHHLGLDEDRLHELEGVLAAAVRDLGAVGFVS